MHMVQLTKYYKKLYKEEEASVFLDISMQLETPASLSERTNRNLEKTADLLEEMAQKGLRTLTLAMRRIIFQV